MIQNIIIPDSTLPGMKTSDMMISSLLEIKTRPGNAKAIPIMPSYAFDMTPRSIRISMSPKSRTTTMIM